MKTFFKLLISALIVGTTNNFVWFALTFFAYLTTKNVISTGVIAGIYLVVTAVSGFWLGSLVDHHKKKSVMLASSAVTLVFFILGFLIYNSAGPDFATLTSPIFWFFSVALLLGVIAGNVYTIALPTLVTTLVEEDKRDKANGMFGTITGISFALTSVASGFILAFGGMFSVLIVAITMTMVALAYLSFVDIPEKKIIHTGADPDDHKKIDIKGTIKVTAGIPGLFALIIFNTFNNLLQGVFMALMDAYGLSLVSVEVWGTMFGFLSMGFIIGGMIVAKFGLGKNPVRTLFRANLLMWTTAIFFTIQPWLALLAGGILVWITLFPIVEAAEQTIIQKVVPQHRQGRVFGFAQSVEQTASPLTAFFIGPIAQLFFIPFMTTGAGVNLIGGWFGVGPGRGLALVFTIAGIVGLCITIYAITSKYYKLLSQKYLKG